MRDSAAESVEFFLFWAKFVNFSFARAEGWQPGPGIMCGSRLSSEPDPTGSSRARRRRAWATGWATNAPAPGMGPAGARRARRACYLRRRRDRL